MNWMKLIRPRLSGRSSFSARSGIEPGLYHYMRQADGTAARFHLRIDAGGNGILLANASSAALLHPSGVIIAKGLLENLSNKDIILKLKKVFKGVTADQAAIDLNHVTQLIKSLERHGRDYPILNPADPSFSPRISPFLKPVSADVPLCEPSFMEPILCRLWDEGIPHVTIVAGNKPDEKHLIRAIEKAEDLGLITGVRGRGGNLAVGNRIPDMAQAGLDHLDVFCLCADDQIHDALIADNDHTFAKKAMAIARKQEICPVAVVALVKQTLAKIDETLAAIAENGIVNTSLFAIATTDRADQAGGALHADELVQAAAIVEESAERCRMRLLWYPPLRYNPAVPLRDQICRGPRAGGDSAIRVNPNGSVIPARGPYQSPGNILKQSWETISKHAIYVDYRRRLETDTHCPTCPGLAICAADCPRNPKGWAEAEKKDEVGRMKDE
jgi:radical SAM protein with 4Fe4S-binding SPASM domain